MGKTYLVPQPPITDKYAFLVDDLNDLSNWGTTSDIDKVWYNMNLLGDFALETELKLPLTKVGLTMVVPLGRFITVIELKDENEGRMTFFDFDTRMPRDLWSGILSKANFSENIIREWLKVYDFLRLDFTEEDDDVILHKPEL